MSRKRFKMSDWVETRPERIPGDMAAGAVGVVYGVVPLVYGVVTLALWSPLGGSPDAWFPLVLIAAGFFVAAWNAAKMAYQAGVMMRLHLAYLKEIRATLTKERVSNGG